MPGPGRTEPHRQRSRAAEAKIAALRERTSNFNVAILRFSVSLDLDTILREAIDGDGALTGLRFGIIRAR